MRGEKILVGGVGGGGGGGGRPADVQPGGHDEPNEFSQVSAHFGDLCVCCGGGGWGEGDTAVADIAACSIFVDDDEVMLNVLRCQLTY